MLDGNIILITGAAKGMGEAHARLCAERGATVLVTDFDRGGAAVAEAINASGGKAHFRQLDVCSEQQWQSCVDWAIENFGRVDGLVNNAGILIRKPVPEIELGEWDALFDINAKGTFLGCKHILPVPFVYRVAS